MPIVQATWKVGIVIGFARFGTVPVVISLRLQQLAMDVAVVDVAMMGVAVKRLQVVVNASQAPR
ncbi:MAG: hypothetical protein ACMG6H_16575 [Acidobacteriota bacterium]